MCRNAKGLAHKTRGSYVVGGSSHLLQLFKAGALSGSFVLNGVSGECDRSLIEDLMIVSRADV